MADKLINFLKDDTQNYPFIRLQLVVDAQLNEPTNQNSIKVHKVKKQTDNKLYYKTLGTSVIDSSMSLP